VAKKKIAMITVGCRANQADSAALLRQVDSSEVEIVNKVELADLVIINTCCVTSEAERDCRKMARRALAASDHTRVLLMGCAVNAFPDFPTSVGADGDSRIEYFHEGNGEAPTVAARINQLLNKAEESTDYIGFSPRVLGRTRALLKIQNGCSHGCAYCIVPRARGPEQSMTRETILEEAGRLKDEGFNEIVLTGVQMGAWGTDLPGKPRLGEMVVEVADRLAPGRVRLSSIEPWSIDEALIEAVGGHSRICAHFHIPLQSGDNRVLETMGRGYNALEYLRKITKIKQTVPDVAIGTDILFGFPGEDVVAFENTLKVLGEMEPAYLHAFPFSPRPGTRAVDLPDQLPRRIAKDRVRTGRALGDQLTESYRTGQLGRSREILVEEKKNREVRGITDTFIPVVVGNGSFKAGDLVMGRLEPATQGMTRLRAVTESG
jgi:threonylcarbamoyladenosine tRNA methylthiotransferase MtaB